MAAWEEQKRDAGDIQQALCGFVPYCARPKGTTGMSPDGNADEGGSLPEDLCGTVCGGAKGLQDASFFPFAAAQRSRYAGLVSVTVGDKNYTLQQEIGQNADRIMSMYEKVVRQNQELVEKKHFLEMISSGLCEKLSAKNEELSAEAALRATAEEALRESEGRYMRLVGAVTDYVYKVEVCGGMAVSTSHGPGCVAVTGYSSEEHADDPLLWHRMIHEEDRELVLQHAGKVLSGEALPSFEHRIVHKDGSIRWVKNTLVLHHDAQGRLVSYDGLIKDITEKKRLEGQLYQSMKMESIGRLAGGIAHDFNNYLGAIIGFSELSFRHMKKEDPCYHNIERIHASAIKAADVTRQLLAFSRKQVVESSILDVNDRIVSCLGVIEPIIGEGVELATALAPDLGRVKAGPAQIEQIVINLAVNARDAMPAGGRITIRTENADLRDENMARQAGVEAGLYVMIEVNDTGAGIPDAVRPHIFEPFFTTKEKDKGTGLGLSTVYGIVEQHSGGISVDSEAGKGTTFTVYMPQVPPGYSQPAAEVAPEAPAWGSETILLVEDSEIVRDFTSQVLRMHGYTVIEADNGHAAMEIFLQNNVVLVITDLVMPNMGGLDFVGQLKASGRSFKTLYMSGHAEDLAASGDPPEGRPDFIAKPFVTADLLRKVREVLDA